MQHTHHRLVAAAIQEMIAALETAIHRGDAAAVEEQSEMLLDLLYELDAE